MKTLQEIYNKHKVGDWPDKGSVHSYIEVYEEILAPYRKSKNVLEIGLFSGESLRMWEEYFEGNVFGIDCSDRPHDGLADLRPMINEGTHDIYILDATDEVQVLNSFCGLDGVKKFDVIIEDAAHNIEQQVQIYNTFRKHIAEGGIYIIEDVQNIDRHKVIFELLDKDKKIEIIDRRSVKGRYDDVLIVVR